MSKLEFRSFALYAWSGGAVWALTFLLLGYTLGEQWETIAELVHRDMVYVSLGLLAAVAMFFLWRRFRQKQPKR